MGHSVLSFVNRLIIIINQAAVYVLLATVQAVTQHDTQAYHQSFTLLLAGRSVTSYPSSLQLACHHPLPVPAGSSCAVCCECISLPGDDCEHHARIIDLFLFHSLPGSDRNGSQNY